MIGFDWSSNELAAPAACDFPCNVTSRVHDTARDFTGVFASPTAGFERQECPITSSMIRDL